jgi:glyoxalase family protein
MTTRTVPDVRPTPSARAGTGVVGLHHVAVVARDPARAADFYGRLLGLDEVGDGPAPAAGTTRPGQLGAAPARWFGRAGAAPGTLVAVVARPDAPPGAPGIGGSHHFALAVRDRAALLRWKRRFVDEGHAVTGILDRHYFQSIYVHDPDGQIVELATLGPGWTIDEDAAHLGESHRDPPAEMINLNRDRARIAAERWPDPVPAIDAAMRIPGLHHVTAIGTRIEGTEAFVAGRLGLRRVKRTNNFDDVGSFHWYWGVGAGAPGTLVTYFDRTPERERPVRMGAGQLAHYAVAAAPAAVDPLRDALAAAGLGRVAAGGVRARRRHVPRRGHARPRRPPGGRGVGGRAGVVRRRTPGGGAGGGARRAGAAR